MTVTDRDTKRRFVTSEGSGARMTKQLCYMDVELFEWIWDVLAKLIHVRLLGMLRGPKRREWKSGRFFTERQSMQYGSGWPETESDFQIAAAHIVQTLPPCGTNMLTPHSIDKVVEEISDIVLMATGASVDVASLRDHIAPICQLLEPT
eukprot:8217783-Karenia_brevis.AAC.1